MKVWVLNKRKWVKGPQAQIFREEAKKLGWRLGQVCAEHFEIVEPDDEPGRIWYKGDYIDLPDVLVTRVAGMTYFGYALVRSLEKMGVRVINSAQAIENAEDKLRTIQLLTAKELPIPTSILAKVPVDCDYVAKKLGFPLVMKTVHGSKGEGVLLLENFQQFKDTVTVLQNSTEGKTNLIFQKYIAASKGRDVRVLVIGKKAVGAALRKGGIDQFKANVSAGGSAEKFELTEDLANLAVRASEALGLEIAGVDFLFDGDKFVIAEVNSSPSFGGFGAVTGLNVQKLVLDHLRNS